MKRVSVVLGAALVLSLAMSGGAQAKCTVACLNHKVRQLSSALIKTEKTVVSLSKTVAQQGQQISAQNQTINQQSQAINGLSPIKQKVDALYECLFEVPISEYGEPSEEIGYLFQFEKEPGLFETTPTTALDVPFEGEPVGAWFLIDGCNTATTAKVKAAAALAPPATGLRQLSRRLP
jgi:uncharacterized coiled-coil protein SlyX